MRSKRSILSTERINNLSKIRLIERRPEFKIQEDLFSKNRGKY
jgi:hypothetical protein